MKKKLLALASLLLLTSSTTTAASPSPEPFTHDEAAIVKVVCNGGTGSATRVSSNTYISVAHVTGLGGCRVDGTPITVTYSNDKQDFSTFIGPVGVATIPISCQGFQSLEGYVMRGYAFGDSSPWFQPVIYVADYKQYGTFVGDAFPGMSGGPVLNRAGKIVGTVNIANPTGSVPLSETAVCRSK